MRAKRPGVNGNRGKTTQGANGNRGETNWYQNQRRRLLVWDAFRGHLTSKVKESVRTKYNTNLSVIPGGCTSKSQPADVSWISLLIKLQISEFYDEWVFSGPVDKTKSGNRHAPSKKLLLSWIKQSWDSITPDVIRKSLKKMWHNKCIGWK